MTTVEAEAEVDAVAVAVAAPPTTRNNKNNFPFGLSRALSKCCAFAMSRHITHTIGCDTRPARHAMYSMRTQ